MLSPRAPAALADMPPVEDAPPIQTDAAPALPPAPRPASALRCGLVASGCVALTPCLAVGLGALEVPPELALVAAVPLPMTIALASVSAMAAARERWTRTQADQLGTRLASIARVDREEAFADLLHLPADHPLADLARAAHDAARSAHADRLEAARLRRDMHVEVERSARRRTARLTKLSTTDDLTGLLNRRGFEEALDAAVAAAREQAREAALVAIDLDRFKALNDARGHEAGDAALRTAGEVLRANIRGEDLGGRMGGDELFLLLDGTDGRHAVEIAERIVRLFARHPAAREEGELWPGLSVGVATVLEGGARSGLELRRMADEALYASKRTGRGRITLHTGSPSHPERAA